MAKITVIDFGMGNLHSVVGGFNYLGADVRVSSNPIEVENADALVLPGVGSFYKAMTRLNSTGLTDAMTEAVKGRKRKILGICLGHQLIADFGEEDGGVEGLGFKSGRVERFPESASLKVPHVGFNSVRFIGSRQLFRGLGDSADFYFVHSYRIEINDFSASAGICNYVDDFDAAYENENIFTTQFHPEKSQTNGLKVLSNFLSV
jgi:imidazole glycerol-phosphate synthase subunit HisH